MNKNRTLWGLWGVRDYGRHIYSLGYKKKGQLWTAGWIFSLFFCGHHESSMLPKPTLTVFISSRFAKPEMRLTVKTGKFFVTLPPGFDNLRKFSCKSYSCENEEENPKSPIFNQILFISFFSFFIYTY